jgi:hypothetical protein
VTVIEDDELNPPRKPSTRVGTAALLDAIRGLPDAVAARLQGTAPTDSGGAEEVTFVGDPLPVEDEKGDPAPAVPAQPDPATHRPAFRHPSARKHRSEAIV